MVTQSRSLLVCNIRDLDRSNSILMIIIVTLMSVNMLCTCTTDLVTLSDINFRTSRPISIASALYNILLVASLQIQCSFQREEDTEVFRHH